MSDKEKFEGMKRQAVEENERAYGKEARALYGNEAGRRLAGKGSCHGRGGMGIRRGACCGLFSSSSPRQRRRGDPEGDAARRLCAMHKRWLCMYGPTACTARSACVFGGGLSQTNVSVRITTRLFPGSAIPLRDAVCAYCAR